MILTPWLIPIPDSLDRLQGRSLSALHHSCLMGIDDRLFESYWMQEGSDSELHQGFRSHELDYCFSKARPFESIAGRWVIKKAASQISSIPWSSFEVQRRPEGVPYLESKHPLFLDWLWEISITHDQHWAYGLVLRGPH